MASGGTGVAEALGELPAGASPAQIFRAAGAAFARGNPSSFAALAGAGLLAAAQSFADADPMTRDSVAAALRAAAGRIAERGGAEVGQRTVLDALVPSTEALPQARPGLVAGLDAMVAAARSGVEATRQMTAVRGRAAWVGDRGKGVADGGATAYLRFLEALRDTLPPSARD